MTVFITSVITAVIVISLIKVIFEFGSLETRADNYQNTIRKFETLLSEIDEIISDYDKEAILKRAHETNLSSLLHNHFHVN